jgi:hypothetical protein
MGIPGMRESLDSIAIREQTDKASVFTRTFAKPHDYCRHLELFFEPIRDKEIKLLEIGCGGGESIRTWLEYFPAAHVFSVDNVHSTNPWNTVTPTAHPRYQFVIGDQSDLTFWQCFVADYGSDWDVLIDDGGHYSNQVITTLNCMWSSIRSGGLYILEDLGCSYAPIFQTQHWPTPIERLHAMIDALHTGNGDVDSI